MNKLFRGNALEFLKTLSDGEADVLLTDPPYSSGGAFRSDRSANTSSKYQNSETVKEYPTFSGDNRDQMSYFYWCALWIGECTRILKPGSFAFMFTDWRQISTTISAFQIGGLVWRGIIPWNKTEAVRPRRGAFRAQCEYVVWGTNGEFIEQTETCIPGFFTYPVIPGEKKHVTGKPEKLITDLLSCVGDRRAVVLDPFMGSGTTGTAAAKLGHDFLGSEINQEYFEIARRDIEAAYAQKNLFIPRSQACEVQAVMGDL